MNPRFFHAGCLTTWFFTASPVLAQNKILNILDNLNVVAGNYTAGNETEGSAFVYGIYTPSSGSRFGFNGGAVANDATNVLWLNNGVSNSNSTNLITGSVVSRVNVSTSLFNLNGNAAGTPAIQQGEATWTNALATIGVNSTSDLTSTLSAASSQWSQLTSNSTGTTPGNGSYTFNATPSLIDGHQIAVFNVAASTIFGSGNFDRFEANFNGAETILINVSGTSFTAGKNFANGFTNNESKIIFNFYEATSISATSNFRGAIFAPLATVSQSSNFDGSVVAASFVQSNEVHAKLFDSYLPFTAIPEPSSSVLGLLAGSFLLRRRRMEKSLLKM